MVALSPTTSLGRSSFVPGTYGINESKFGSCSVRQRRTNVERYSVQTFASVASPEVKNSDLNAPDKEYTPSGMSSMNVMTVAVNSLFSFQPFFRFAASKAREMMVKRGDVIGYPWAPALSKLREHDWEAEAKQIERVDLEYPEYYIKPFHAYEKGNLSWDAALEADLAARSVHATVFDPSREAMDSAGDSKMRQSYHQKMKSLLRLPGGAPRNIVDVGCATGLSTFALHETFPEAKLIGLDLSPYFLSVANYKLRQILAEGSQLQVQFKHAAGEATGLPSESVDLVSICLVCHELPRSATKKIIEEAHRILCPGGALSIMEMNPHSPILQQMVNNVFAFTAFKATEPYFDDYRTFPIEEAIAERGFEHPQQLENTPRHRTIVAHKL